jgi:hypothetical protein
MKNYETKLKLNAHLKKVKNAKSTVHNYIDSPVKFSCKNSTNENSNIIDNLLASFSLNQYNKKMTA